MFEEVEYTLGSLTLRGLVRRENHSLKSSITKNTANNVVLCLHGWLDNAASFLPLLDKIPNKTLVAIDWFGHGLSDHRSVDSHYHFIDWIYDIAQLVEQQKWQQVDIVGHSMGGMVASAFAAAFPEKVKSLTLLDTLGFISQDPEQSTEQLRAGMLSRLKRGEQIRRFDASQKLALSYSSLDSAINARLSVSDMRFDDAKLIVKRNMLKQDNAYSWRVDQRLKNISPYRFTLAQAQQLVSDIKCPVQLIYGKKLADNKQGFIINELLTKAFKDYAHLLPHLTCIPLIGGHHIHMEQPEKTAKLINAFIDTE